jgi:hypothetical protein
MTVDISRTWVKHFFNLTRHTAFSGKTERSRPLHLEKFSLQFHMSGLRKIPLGLVADTATCDLLIAIQL